MQNWVNTWLLTKMCILPQTDSLISVATFEGQVFQSILYHCPHPLQLLSFAHGIHIRLSAVFSAENIQTIRECHDRLKVLIQKNLQPKTLYPARLLLRMDGKVKNFSEKQKWKGYSNTKPILKELLKDVL